VLDGDGEPLLGIGFDLVLARQLGASAVLDVVEAEVLFERVVAADVLVVRIDRSPDESAALVDLAGDRLGADA
jgi:hypothetical protein